MLKIDFHTHCFPDPIAGHALEVLSANASIPYLHDGTAAGLDDFERSGGCDGYVVMPIATSPKQTASVNLFAGGLVKPERHVYAFGSIHPENTDYKARLADVKALGLYGIKMHPEYQRFHINDEKMFPVYDEIFRLGLPLMFHAGEDKGFTPPWHAEPYKITEVARRYPQAVIIAAHLGGYRMWREAAGCLPPYPNVHIDVSFVAGNMPMDEFSEACGAWSSDRILFGSDSPWSGVKGSICAVERLGRPAREMEMIFSGNALRILGV